MIWNMPCFPSPTEHRSSLETIDQQFIEIQQHAEEKCRKIQRGAVPFFEDSKLWNFRRCCYNDLLKRMDGKTANSNILKRAWEAGITNPKQLTYQQLLDGKRYCKYQLITLKKHANESRRVHLRNCFVRARELKNKDKANKSNKLSSVRRIKQCGI